MKKRLICPVCMLLLLAGAYLTVLAGPNPGCPQDNTGTVTFLPHPESYEQYYMCINGIAFLQDCPQGLWWNTMVEFCDWPENVMEDEFW